MVMAHTDQYTVYPIVFHHFQIHLFYIGVFMRLCQHHPVTRFIKVLLGKRDKVDIEGSDHLGDNDSNGTGTLLPEVYGQFIAFIAQFVGHFEDFRACLLAYILTIAA